MPGLQNNNTGTLSSNQQAQPQQTDNPNNQNTQNSQNPNTQSNTQTRPTSRRHANSSDLEISDKESVNEPTLQEKFANLNQYLTQIENREIAVDRSAWMAGLGHCFVNNGNPQQIFWDYCYDITPIANINEEVILGWIERGDTVKLLPRKRLRTYASTIIDRTPTAWETKEWFFEIWTEPATVQTEPPPTVTRTSRLLTGIQTLTPTQIRS